MSTKSFTPDHEADYTTREIERYYDQQDHSARRRPWLLGAGAAVVVAGVAAVALTFTSSGSTPVTPAGTSTSTVSPAVPSHPGAPTANPAVPSSPVQGTGASAG